MTKKDYIKIATAIRENRSYPWGDDRLGAAADAFALDLINNLCVVFTADNPRFDAETFRQACRP